MLINSVILVAYCAFFWEKHLTFAADLLKHIYPQKTLHASPKIPIYPKKYLCKRHFGQLS